MEISAEIAIIIVSALLLVCVFVSKISDRLGVPILLLFIGIGMLVGSEGIGGVYFDDPHITQIIGNIALAVILFSSGLDTKWQSVKPVMKEGISLATFGVIITAAVFGGLAYLVLKLSLLESFLIGAIISSTDAAAVFSILRSRSIRLKEKLASVLELESGGNDPIAVLLTITLIGVLNQTSTTAYGIVGAFLLQMLLGLAFGWIFSIISLFLINKFKIGYEGLYPLLLISMVLLAFNITTVLKGSGFLAVYVFGLLLGKNDFLHKHSAMRFFDSTAWFSQIALFLSLGLLVFPSRLLPVIPLGMLLAFCLVFIARPVAVFLSLLPFKYSIKEKLFISWVGLRGAVPIVLATFPLAAGIQNADLIFNIVFFVVLVSVLLQGILLGNVARWLKLENNEPLPSKQPIELIQGDQISSQLKEVVLPDDAASAGKTIMELGLPAGFLIVLISRGDSYVLPNGGTQLAVGDVIYALTEPDCIQVAQDILSKPTYTKPN